MRAARLAFLLAPLGLALLAGSSQAAVRAPRDLHGFLLRADEPRATSFHRTPSFAWSPVPGALRYELQLSTSSTFRANGILYDDPSLATPVAAPPLTLPWITGSPHALYARVRAILPDGATPWSAPFGFDVTPPPPPTPLAGYPGLLRWTPVEGADAYEVWLVDAGKHELVRTNALDERELYAFHASPQWIGTVRWRVRALRHDVSASRLNGIPATTYGPWSPIYASSNPAPVDAPIRLVATVSTVVSDGSASSPAHPTMPAFVWTGDETVSGTPAQLFRVYVFTDRQCLNLVDASAAVATPAWAPRLSGPLAQPASAAGLTAAATSYLPDGRESASLSFDAQDVTRFVREQAPPATPTTQAPGEVPSFPGATLPADPAAGSPPASSGSGGSTPGGGSGTTDTSGTVGPPVDLWDTSWPESGYYWTVVAVAPVVGAGGNVVYQDLELPQDVCGAGRVQRFGIESPPSLTTSARAPFATGLSASGRLVSAAGRSSFYGQPLVAWTPALGASAYEVQWSRRRYPFTPEPDPRTGAKGLLTFSTAAVLPLPPGTWWYRVRGFDYNLPTGVQQLSWSAPQKLVVAAPRFRIAKAHARPSRFTIVRGSP